MEEDDPYVGREQTLVKHFILQKYLSRFAPIVLSHWDSISYVDCFSGPWNAHTDDLRDTSFSIALEELRRARPPCGFAPSGWASLLLSGTGRRCVRQTEGLRRRGGRC